MSELLRTLGQRVGIVPEYVNFDGTQRVTTPDETYRAILKCLGYDVDDAASLRDALDTITKRNPSPAATISSVKCLSCAEVSSKRQLRGIWCNLYSLRSATNWGVGDFGDLRRLVKWAGEVGLDFVALNPLHALRDRGHDVSPYRPVSRLYRNEIYLELEAIPEFEISDEAQKALNSQLLKQLEHARAAPIVDYDEVSRLKRHFLRLVHEQFREMHGQFQTERGQEYRGYLEKEGTALRDFATFMVLDEMSAPRSSVNMDGWSAQLSNRRSAEVRDFQRKHAIEIDFHCFVQFELDRQLASIAKQAKQSGMAIGLFGDLAIGTAPDGSDPWAYSDLFLYGVSIGAPPDDLGPQGQNWSLPPINPRVLADSGFAYWKKLLQNNLSRMGALRIDHVMGLLRQFWIPDGFDGSKGAYMQFPAQEMFSILAEESRRNGTVIIGEDLGTVPEGFRDLMQRFGLLSTRVLYFERESDGSFKPAAAYPKEAYAVVATHDMAPLAGFAEGRDLQLRRQLDLIPTNAQFEEAMTWRKATWRFLVRRLIDEGLADSSQSENVSIMVHALVKFLAKTPACLIGFSLDDLALEPQPINVPGVGQDRHKSWSRRMTMRLEEIISSPSIKSLLDSLPE